MIPKRGRLVTQETHRNACMSRPRWADMAFGAAIFVPKPVLVLLGIFVFSVTLSSCASGPPPTIVNFPVKIVADVDGARVEINDELVGHTPMIYTYRFWSNHPCLGKFWETTWIKVTAPEGRYKSDSKRFSGSEFCDLAARIPKVVYFETGGKRTQKQDNSVAALAPPKKPVPDKKDNFGTGFLVNDDGEVVSNAHVVQRCKSVKARIRDFEFEVEVVVQDGNNDLAILRVSQEFLTALRQDFVRQTGIKIAPNRVSRKVATFSKATSIRAGSQVVVVGHPLPGLLSSGANVTTGVISALAGIRNDKRMFQITAPIQPGSSGGPVIDMNGNLVGVVVAKLDALAVATETGDIPQNVNFAINSEVLRAFLSTHSIRHHIGGSKDKLGAADIGEIAMNYTFSVRCIR